jgi:hypothetical protein
MDITRIDTVRPINNERVFLSDGGIWRAQDVDTGKFLTPYQEVDRDETYIYIRWVDDADDHKRISQFGGPMELLQENGQWKALYKNTIAY